LGHRHALHAVDTALELQAAEGAPSLDERNDLLEAAETRRVRAHRLDLPTTPFGISGVHPNEIGGEEARLLTSGPGPDLEENVALVSRVARQQQPLELRLDHRGALA